MGVLAATINIDVQAGATWEDTLRYSNKATGNPIDLTGFEARMQLRSRIEDATVVMELSTTDGRLAITPAAGRIDIHVDAEDTTTLCPDNKDVKYAYGLELFKLVDGTEYVISLLKGAIAVAPEVVR